MSGLSALRAAAPVRLCIRNAGGEGHCGLLGTQMGLLLLMMDSSRPGTMAINAPQLPPSARSGRGFSDYFGMHKPSKLTSDSKKVQAAPLPCAVGRLLTVVRAADGQTRQGKVQHQQGLLGGTPVVAQDGSVAMLNISATWSFSGAGAWEVVAIIRRSFRTHPKRALCAASAYSAHQHNGLESRFHSSVLL